MSSNFTIGVRFLLAKRKSMLMSLAGITFGVGFFIVTQAQTSGFEGFFVKTILGTNGALRVRERIQDTLRSMSVDDNGEGFQISHKEGKRYVGDVAQPELLADAIRQFGNVAGVSRVVTGSGQLALRGQTRPVQAYGILLDDHLGVSDLSEQIVFGELSDFRRTANGVLLSRYLAERLDVGLGEKIVFRAAGKARKLTVSAIYETGVRDIDKVRLFIHLRTARSILGKPFGASFLQVSLFDNDRAPHDARRMIEVTSHHVSEWQRREKVWLDVFKILRLSSAITVSVIILISGLGMFSVLAIIVMEKTREIAILRSMGYQRGDISKIFLWQGFVITLSGTLAGWIFGFLMTLGLANLPIRIRGIFSTDRFVVNWSLSHYLTAALIAFVVVMLASYFPARRAARLEPADVIRGTSA